MNLDGWKDFTVNDLFEIKNGKGITQEEIQENPGTFEAVQSGSENNAVMGLIDREYCVQQKYTMTDEMCLSVARSGTSGFVALHDRGCVVGDSAKILLLRDRKHANVFVYLFIQTLLAANQFKFNYGRKVKTDLYKEMVVKLPVKENQPDWGFMENVIRKCMSKTYEKFNSYMKILN